MCVFVYLPNFNILFFFLVLTRQYDNSITEVIVKVNVIPTTNAITSRTVELISSLLPCGRLLRVEAGAAKEREIKERRC